MFSGAHPVSLCTAPTDEIMSVSLEISLAHLSVKTAGFIDFFY